MSKRTQTGGRKGASATNVPPTSELGGTEHVPGNLPEQPLPNVSGIAQRVHELRTPGGKRRKGAKGLPATSTDNVDQDLEEGEEDDQEQKTSTDALGAQQGSSNVPIWTSSRETQPLQAPGTSTSASMLDSILQLGNIPDPTSTEPPAPGQRMLSNYQRLYKEYELTFGNPPPANLNYPQIEQTLLLGSTGAYSSTEQPLRRAQLESIDISTLRGMYEREFGQPPHPTVHTKKRLFNMFRREFPLPSASSNSAAVDDNANISGAIGGSGDGDGDGGDDDGNDGEDDNAHDNEDVAELREVNEQLEDNVLNLLSRNTALENEMTQMRSELALALARVAALPALAQPVQAAAPALPTAPIPLTVQSAIDVRPLTDLSPEAVKRFVTQFKPGMAIRPIDLMSNTVVELLNNHVKGMYKHDPTGIPDWPSWPAMQFCDWIVQNFPADSASASQPLLERIKNLTFEMDPLDPTALDRGLSRLIDIEQTTSRADLDSNQEAAVGYLVKFKLKNHPNAMLAQVAERMRNNTIAMPTTLEDFRVELLAAQREYRQLLATVSTIATVHVKGVYPSTNKTAFHQKTKTYSQSQPKPTQKPSFTSTSTPSAPTEPRPTIPCNVCGKMGHRRASCKCLNKDGRTSWHPNANLSNLPWLESKWGLEYKSRKGMTYLPFHSDVDGNEVIPPAWTGLKKTGHGNKPGTSTSKGPPRKSLVTALLARLQTTNSNDYIPCHLTLTSQTNPISEADCLLDNGALGVANFVSKDIATKLISAGASKRVVSQSVASAFTNISCISNEQLSFDVILTTESDSKTSLRLSIDAFTLDSELDLILGRETIKKYNLANYFPSHFYSMHTLTSNGDRGVRVMDASQSALYSDCKPKVVTAMHLRGLTDSELPHDTSIDDDSEWHAPAFEAFESVLTPTQSDDFISLMTIETDDELHRSDIISLLHEYRDIFSETLNQEPALVPPLELTVDISMWEQPKHHTPPRPQTPANQVEVKRQLDLLLSQNIIQPSQASFYSQVHLAEKPPKGSGQKRFCIDYILLNLCTTISDQWPLPNIQQMLRRVGNQRPKYFAVFDLTAGYHQAPVSYSAIGFTAFICFCGIYEYLRVPFGLKGAPSYFQRVMAGVVLAGLVYIICEVYIDDIIVYARTAAEVLQNMRRVFDRIRKHRLLFHPKKARIGMSSVEYTGHVLDRTGLSFSPKKIQGVLDFPVPQQKQNLKQFLGLANYFRDHVRNHSNHAAPLQRHLGNYSKKRDAHKPLDLDEEGLAAFNTIKEMIQNCPKLFFLDDVSPIVLYTDACTYGLGGYLAQLVKSLEGHIKEHPIMFMSKSFSITQLKWHIPQKEAYAIFAAIHAFEHLLRDRHFIIKTDHKNITFMNNSDLSSIRKQKIYISEFDYELDYLKGEENFVADAFSRLCRDLTPDPDKLESILLAAMPDRIHIPPKAYEAISKVHNKIVGHHGVERTVDKLLRWCKNTSTEPWPQLRQHVKQFIRICPCCQKMSLLKTPIVAHPFTVSSYWPMERLQMDFIGPFPDGGYILAIICCFTRWIELFHCLQANADCASRRLLEHIGRYGAPTQLLSDRGSHFVNEVISELLRLVGTEHCLSIAYSKEESAIVERSNRETNRHLRNMFFHEGVVNDYIKNIPLVQRIENSSPNSRTRLTPAQLLFGNKIDLDRGIFLPKKELPTSSTPLSKPMSSLLQAQAKLLQLARDNIQAADDAHFASAPPARTEFPINSYVLLEYPDSPPSRLHAKKRGPYQVVKFNKNDYTLRDLISHKELTVNVTRLTPFVYDPVYTDPRKVAMAEQDEFDIDFVLAHRGNLNQKSTLEFKVRWLGFDESFDSWEPWSELRDTAQLHSYLKLKGLERFIPRKFKTTS